MQNQIDPRSLMDSAVAPRLREMLRNRAWDFFSYGAFFDTIAAGATETEDVQIQNDSDFLIMAATATVAEPATPGTALAGQPFLAQIRDAGSGRAFFNRPTNGRNLFGTGERPCYWPFYRVVRSGSTLSIDATNQTAAAAAIWIDFIGVKVFKSNVPT